MIAAAMLAGGREPFADPLRLCSFPPVELIE